MGKSTRQSLSFGSLSVRSVIPNVVTLLALIVGLTAIRFALREEWGMAVSAIILAGVLDGLDGTVARLLKATSRFGAELDSLSDNVAFGVAPAVTMYLWCFDQLDRLGWALAVLFSVAMALRLARFNAGMSGDTDGAQQRYGYLTGVPAPAGAGLLMCPILLDLSFGQVVLQALPYWVAVYTVFLSCLMVSTIPTFSPRLLRLRREFFVPLMLAIAALLAGIFVHTWNVLLGIGAVYLITLPITFVTYRRRRQQKTRMS